jgi:uncharacterized membrane protein
MVCAGVHTECYMISLYAGMLLFAGPHLFSMLAPAARLNLLQRMGENAYKALYSVVSLVGIILLSYGYWQGRDGGELFYEPWLGSKHVAMLLVLVGFLLIFSNMRNNHIRALVKQPFSIGIALWAAGHLLANGEKAVVLIFGMFLILALIDIVLSTVRGKVQSFVPEWRNDVSSVVIGLVLFLAFMFGFHPYILGVPVAG